jgi:uncharacterized Fe-S cluster-containing radical SAM superfamily enzyme
MISLQIIFVVKVFEHVELINFKTHGHTSFLDQVQMLKTVPILHYGIIRKINLRVKACDKSSRELASRFKIYVIEHVKEILYDSRHKSVDKFMFEPRLQLNENLTFLDVYEIILERPFCKYHDVFV